MRPLPDSYGPCPCGCPVRSAHASAKTGHVRGCVCRPCVGRRSRRAGRKHQTDGHRALGGDPRFSPANEETARTYTVELMVEHKSGDQVPRSFRKFVALEWTRRALSQAERALPVGSGARPAITMSWPGSSEIWGVVRLR